MDFITYQGYTKQVGYLPVADAEKIYSTILENAKTATIEFKALWHDVVDAAIKYASMRAKWLTLSQQERIDADAQRTVLHNDLIFSITLLHGYFAEQGWNVDWIDLFNINGDIDRKRIGDFGCYVAYVYGVNAR